jgi:myo-inositol-1(or 4)-monophosphatase
MAMEDFLNHSHICNAGIEAALAAGDLLSKGFGTTFTIDSKPEGHQNLVTEYDKAAEALIFETLLRNIPSSSFLAEESGSIAGREGADSVLWIIDPLDGTVNFAHGIPIFSVSIAAYVDGQVVAGVVYHPLLKELFVAERGKGATLNHKPLRVSKNNSNANAIVTTGFPYNVEENPLGCIDTLERILKSGIPVRRLGSAAIDLAYLAAGRFDAYWEVILHPWDMAAGILLVEEAGGKVTDYNGRPINATKDSALVASNGIMHPFMLNTIGIR